MTHAPPTDTLVSVRDLQKTYGKGSFFGSKFHALRGVSLEVGRGTVFGLLGPNGAGKTTMIKILLGLVRRFEGEATLFGRHPDDPASRMRVGYLPEAHRLPSYLTGRQMLELSGMHSGRSLGWVRERMPDWLDRVGMTAAADRKIRTYSKGMQQRIGLAQAMIHEPELLFLDEPTSAVDPETRRGFWERLFDLVELGTTMIVSTHLMDEAERCHRIAILDRGRKCADGTPPELMEKAEGRVVEVAGDDLRRIGRELAGHPDIASVAQIGTLLRVLVAEATTEAEAVVAQALRGHPELSVRAVRPNLEDVFVLATHGGAG